MPGIAWMAIPHGPGTPAAVDKGEITQKRGRRGSERCVDRCFARVTRRIKLLQGKQGLLSPLSPCFL